MANPQKPTFSFGSVGQTPSTGAPTSNLFGQTSSSQPPSSGLFGSSANPPASGGSGLFGSTPATSGGSGLFGGGSAVGGSTSFGGATSGGGGNGGGSGLFSGAAKAPTGGFSFGQPSNTANSSGSGLFGSAPASSQTSQPATTATSAPSSFFTTPSKPNEPPNTQSQTPKPLFGAQNPQGGSGLFGNMSSNPSTTTPTSKPTSSLFGASTTPAGPPPASSVGPSSTPAGQPQGQNSSNPFAGFSKPASSAPNGGGATTSTAPSNLFNTNNQTSSASNLFGGQSTTQPVPPGSGLFQNLNNQQGKADGASNSQANGPTSGAPAKNQSSGSNLFGNVSSAPTSSAPSSFSFAKPSLPASSASLQPAPAATSGGFSLGSKPAATSTSGAPATNATSSSLFGAPKSQESQPASTAAPASAAPAAGNFFSNLSKSSAPPASATTSTAPVAEASKPAGNAETSQAANLTASTAGPAPPAQSRLKNKSMDDIITRWATDLSKYQKEFQTQAEKVAKWDRMLVENSEKIQKLYGQTLEAERATSEVERQLSAVESDQAELESWLNHYEQEVDALIKQQGDGEAATGPDAERQRTYQLAGRLTERLDEMGRDLGSMIEEINDTSTVLSKNNKKDDALSQVVRVLNSHLVQLQHIDQGAAALNQKVLDAQRAAKTMRPGSGYNGSLIGGANSAAADGFERSMRRGR